MPTDPTLTPVPKKVKHFKVYSFSGRTTSWSNGLSDDPQDYAVIPEQPWLDGFNVSEDYIRQFVAMPLGEGYTAEEQITGKAEHGGLQIIVYPMKHDLYVDRIQRILDEEIDYLDMPSFCRKVGNAADLEMGLAPGGLMRQRICEDEYGIDAWDQNNGYRCFVHLTNSEQYQSITGHPPPHKPPTAHDYTHAGLPWFDYYDDSAAISGSDTLSKLTSVAAKVIEQGKGLLPNNDPVQPKTFKIISKGNVVRDGEF